MRIKLPSRTLPLVQSINSINKFINTIQSQVSKGIIDHLWTSLQISW